MNTTKVGRWPGNHLFQKDYDLFEKDYYLISLGRKPNFFVKALEKELILS